MFNIVNKGSVCPSCLSFTLGMAHYSIACFPGCRLISWHFIRGVLSGGIFPVKFCPIPVARYGNDICTLVQCHFICCGRHVVTHALCIQRQPAIDQQCTGTDRVHTVIPDGK